MAITDSNHETDDESGLAPSWAFPFKQHREERKYPRRFWAFPHGSPRCGQAHRGWRMLSMCC